VWFIPLFFKGFHIQKRDRGGYLGGSDKSLSNKCSGKI